MIAQLRDLQPIKIDSATGQNVKDLQELVDQYHP